MSLAHSENARQLPGIFFARAFSLLELSSCADEEFSRTSAENYI
jgi:hypothetical protein